MKTIVLALVGMLTAGAGMAQKAAGPDAQEWLSKTVEKYALAYPDAANDMAKGLVRRERAETLCPATGPIKAGRGLVKDWIGYIRTLDAVSDGRGILAVRISDRITVKTTNNDFSEKFGGHPTLIAIGSSLYKAVILLKVGQKVKFSGTFFGSKDDCMQELSLTPPGAMEAPEFLFRFDAVQPSE